MSDRISLRFGLACGGEIVITAPASEAEWLRALFAANKDPFKTLLEIGFEIGCGDEVTVPVADPTNRPSRP